MSATTSTVARVNRTAVTSARRALLRAADRLVPPHVAVYELSIGMYRTHLLGAIAELGVADELRDDPATAAQLADRLDVDAEALHRLLRAAATMDVTTLDRHGRFALTRTGREQFNISRTTVRQALQDLAVEGRIVRRKGRGTFVAPPKVTQNLQLTSYTQDMVAQGRRPGSKLVDVAVIDAEADVAGKLGLPERAKVLRLERVRYADGDPMAVETVYLDHERFADIGDLLTTDLSLYQLLDDRYGVIPVAADETIETVLATPAASRLLGTDATTPMLLLTRSSSDAAGRPVEYVRSLYRGDRYRFIARIRRPTV